MVSKLDDNKMGNWDIIFIRLFYSFLQTDAKRKSNVERCTSRSCFLHARMASCIYRIWILCPVWKLLANLWSAWKYYYFNGLVLFNGRYFINWRFNKR